MLLVLSPAKALDFESPLATRKHSQPAFLDDAATLIAKLRRLSPGEVSDLMGISTQLGELNCDRFNEWSPPFTPENARPAALAFKGDVYMGMQAWGFSERDFAWAQQRVRILSGLYGVLKPLDLIQPYRLEMGTRFENPRGKNLYEFWGNKLTDALNDALDGHRSKTLVNLASNEYWNAVQVERLAARVVTPVFKDLKHGRYRVISFYAKKARGLMARFIVENRVDAPRRLAEFDGGGYRYAADLSSAATLTFLRDRPA